MAFEVGTRRNLDVLNAISQVADSQQKLTKSRVDAIVAHFKLKGAVGRLSEADLRAVNSFLGD
jgi:outer membrane protein